MFNALDLNQPWGGLEFRGDGGQSRLQHAFLTHGGADTSLAIRAVRPYCELSARTVVRRSLSDRQRGQRFRDHEARVGVSNSVLSNVDTGGEFVNSVVTIDHTWLMNIRRTRYDVSLMTTMTGLILTEFTRPARRRLQDSFVINTKDDGL